MRQHAKDFIDFMQHPVARDIVKYNLFIAINCIIDIASHIVTDEGFGEIDLLAVGFRILEEPI